MAKKGRKRNNKVKKAAKAAEAVEMSNLTGQAVEEEDPRVAALSLAMKGLPSPSQIRPEDASGEPDANTASLDDDKKGVIDAINKTASLFGGEEDDTTEPRPTSSHTGKATPRSVEMAFDEPCLQLMNPDHPIVMNTLDKCLKGGNLEVVNGMWAFRVPMMWNDQTTNKGKAKKEDMVDGHPRFNSATAVGQQDGQQHSQQGENTATATPRHMVVFIAFDENDVYRAQPGPPLEPAYFPPEDFSASSLYTLERVCLTKQQLSATMLFTAKELWGPPPTTVEGAASAHASSHSDTTDAETSLPAPPMPTGSDDAETSLQQAVHGPREGFWREAFNISDERARMLQQTFVTHISRGELESAWEVAESFSLAMLTGNTAINEDEPGPQPGADGEAAQLQPPVSKKAAKRRRMKQRKAAAGHYARYEQTPDLDRSKLWVKHPLFDNELILPAEHLLGSFDSYEMEQYVIRDRRALAVQQTGQAASDMEQSTG